MRAMSSEIFDHIWRISACGPKTGLEISGSGAFALKIKGFQKLSLEIMRKENFFSKILRNLARSKYERARKCGHTMTEKHLQVLPQLIIYDCTISEDNFARQPKLTKVEEYAYKEQQLMSVYIKMEFESEGGRKVCKSHRVERHQST